MPECDCPPGYEAECGRKGEPALNWGPMPECPSDWRRVEITPGWEAIARSCLGAGRSITVIGQTRHGPLPIAGWRALNSLSACKEWLASYLAGAEVPTDPWPRRVYAWSERDDAVAEWGGAP